MFGGAWWPRVECGDLSGVRRASVCGGEPGLGGPTSGRARRVGTGKKGKSEQSLEVSRWVERVEALSYCVTTLYS